MMRDLWSLQKGNSYSFLNADLYVSPGGDNDNSGLSPDDSLQSINLAYSMIESDSLHPHTIHLADGVYSPSLNEQKFPVQTRGYVSLIGESKENSILDAEYESSTFWQNSGEFPYSLTSDSPCINAGTLDLPPGIELPDYDLAGNPRIVNGMIDMGAYEYQDSVFVSEKIIKPIHNNQT